MVSIKGFNDGQKIKKLYACLGTYRAFTGARGLSLFIRTLFPIVFWIQIYVWIIIYWHLIETQSFQIAFEKRFSSDSVWLKFRIRIWIRIRICVQIMFSLKKYWNNYFSAFGNCFRFDCGFVYARKFVHIRIRTRVQTSCTLVELHSGSIFCFS